MSEDNDGGALMSDASGVEAHGGFTHVGAPPHAPRGLCTVEPGARWYAQCSLCYTERGKPGLTVGSATTRALAEAIGMAHVVAHHPIKF